MGFQKIRADGGLCRTAPGSGRYFCKHAPHKEDAFLRRHPAQKIVISLTVLDTKLTGRMRLAEQRTPFGHPVFLQHRAEDAFDVLVLEDTGSSGADRHATAAGAPSCCTASGFCRSPQFKPGHHTFHPALYVIALPYRQVGHFVQHLRKFKGKKLLTDQRKVEGKKVKRVTG